MAMAIDAAVEFVGRGELGGGVVVCVVVFRWNERERVSRFTLPANTALLTPVEGSGQGRVV
jgi:hypothetical protein